MGCYLGLDSETDCRGTPCRSCTANEPSAASEGYDLKPCPFCGGKAGFDHDDNGWNWVECSQCHTSSRAAVHSMEDCRLILAEAWNRRV